MIIGKIEIQLNNLNGYLEDNESEVINRYLNGDRAIGTIRELIEIIADTDLLLYTVEEFSPLYVYKRCEYKPVSPEQLQEFINHKAIDPSKEVSPSYYANFLYKDGKAIDPVTEKEPIDVGFILV
ncbi:hypothetical protein ACLI1A_00470 [Flavobacterium sp. RHBU_3]|uniref:hypothetical protein n=1 Tax=Flavobacterium sp. RHBU_3 TaxID=3391184 RepID=UPI003984D74E